MLKAYLELVKPERTLANVITAVAGYMLGSANHFNWGRFIATIVGISLVIASACVANNLIDQDIDQIMSRTARRVLVKRVVSARSAAIYSGLLGLLGFFCLARYVSWLVVILGLVAYIDYVVLYGLAKRRSVHSTIIGSVSGAMSITAGYCAAKGRLDSTAIILFLIMTFWQMPHFYAIAIFRRKDYAAANIPVLSVVKGTRTTKWQILIYTFLFLLACLSLAFFGQSGFIYLITVLFLGGIWLRRAWRGLAIKPDGDVAWARQLFGFSLIVLSVISAVLALNRWLP